MDPPSHHSQDGLSKLYHAASSGSVDVCAALLESGADPDFVFYVKPWGQHEAPVSDTIFHLLGLCSVATLGVIACNITEIRIISI